MLLSSEFQGFGRDLYSECVEHFVSAVGPILEEVVRSQFLWGLPFGRGNPNAAAIGSDFGRLGLPFWEEVKAVHRRNAGRKQMLDELMRWRNAISHNDFSPSEFGSAPVLRLDTVRKWRAGLNGLCDGFDRVLRNHLTRLLGVAPWHS